MSGSLGDLLAKAGFAATAQEDEPEARESTTEPPAVHYGPKVVLGLQRKGHGGRTVTTVSGVLSGHDTLAKTLRKQLGAGVRVDDATMILQGDQRERTARWFESQGVKQVVRG